MSFIGFPVLSSTTSTPTLATKAGAKVETAQNPISTAFFQFMTIST